MNEVLNNMKELVRILNEIDAKSSELHKLHTRINELFKDAEYLDDYDFMDGLSNLMRGIRHINLSGEYFNVFLDNLREDCGIDDQDLESEDVD